MKYETTRQRRKGNSDTGTIKIYWFVHIIKEKQLHSSLRCLICDFNDERITEM